MHNTRPVLVISGLLAFLLASLLLGACSGGNKEAAAPEASASPSPVAGKVRPLGGEQEAGRSPLAAKVKPVHFSVFVNYDWYTAPAWEGRPQAQWITSHLHVTLKPVQSGGSAAQKLNALLVASRLPDVIVLDRGKDVERLQKAGQLVAIDPYLAKYPEFVRNVGEETLNMLRSEDGHLYQIPNWYISGDNGSGNAGYLVEKKIYKALGSPPLETWDELTAYLRMVQKRFPDVVPVGFGETRDGADVQSLGMLYSGAAAGRTPAFISPASGQIFGVPAGDELVSVYRDQAFKDAARLASRLFREGLADGEMLTQTRDQVLEKLKTGKIAVFGAYDAVVEGIGREANNRLSALDPEDGYTLIWPVHQAGVDRNRVYPASYNTLGWNVNVITANAADPEAIFSYMNWATSPEGQRILFFGPEGLFYNEVKDGVPIPNAAYISRDLKQYDDLRIGEFNWYGNTSYIDSVKARREKLLPEEAQDWTMAGQTAVTFKTSLNITEFSNLDPGPETEEGIILQRLKDQYALLVPKLLFAASDEEVLQLIEEADRQAAELGYDKVLRWKTAVWQENLAKLSGPSGP
jgi:putative aldouronate transport system substrate-binding protein